MKKAISLINSLNIPKTTPIVVACSYGPDSMVLLDLLNKMNYKIVIAHVNHGVRKESIQEAIDLKKYALNHNIIMENTEFNKVNKGNFEEVSRNKRYKFYEKVMKKYNSNYLFMGHHGDDLIETILMRLIRGSSFKGYKGFDKVTFKNNYYIVRPLYYYSKENIFDYAKRHNVPYSIDKTNKEDIYTRNKIRNHILPFLKEENKDVHLKFIKFNEDINEHEMMFSKETERILKKVYTDHLDLKKFFEYDYLYQKRILNDILLNTYKNKIKLIGDKHVDFIFNLIYSKKPNGYITLPLEYKIIKEYNKLYFEKSIKFEKYEKVLFDNLKINNHYFYRDDLDDDNNESLIRLKIDEIKMPIKIRTRENGDFIEPKNFQGTKKVKSLFINFKVPFREREQYPIMVDSDGNIIWIPNLSKSKYHKQNDEDYDIIIKHEKRGE